MTLCLIICMACKLCAGHLWTVPAACRMSLRLAADRILLAATTQEEAQEYKEESKLRELVAQYSEFINFPIYLWTTKETEVEVPDEEAQAAADAAREAKSEEDEIEDEGAPPAK